MHRNIILSIKRLNFFFSPRLLVYKHQAHKKIGTVIIIQELYIHRCNSYYSVPSIRLSTSKHPLIKNKKKYMYLY